MLLLNDDETIVGKRWERMKEKVIIRLVFVNKYKTEYDDNDIECIMIEKKRSTEITVSMWYV